ncbi:MAG: endonuclease III [Clostridia bacterium]|nr:endonuclease III [Clostridia bacterium]
MEISTANEILSELTRLYPDARPALKYSSPYELLVAVILSAQCTDERVNKVTEVLFKNYNTPEKILTLTREELEKYIYSCGFFRAKASHILSASKDIIEKYGGEVPGTQEKLKTLSGVGQKTANVVYAVAFGGDAIAVDTHVFRVSNRLGLASASTPEKTEEQLKQIIPREEWSKAHHLIIYHGRRVCHSQKPDCQNCTLRNLCEHPH